jgi:HrpA-like RNA helicase
MLLEDSRTPAPLSHENGASAAPAAQKDAHIMVSQPRRIAATALKNRLAQTLGDTIGLRLGKGRREESSETRIWFVTTGYLVRLLAHKLHTFAKFTHLVIDEIHERSLDCDLLCYLAKRLLHVFPHIKIVLMSATAHSAMFQSYFNSAEEAIFVGVRRFPLQEWFAEDLYGCLPSAGQKILSRVVDGTSRCAHRRSVHEVVPDGVVKDQLSAAAMLAREIATPGGAVLIFVSGMADITELMELLTTQMQNSRRGECLVVLLLLLFVRERLL